MVNEKWIYPEDKNLIKIQLNWEKYHQDFQNTQRLCDLGLLCFNEVISDCNWFDVHDIGFMDSPEPTRPFPVVDTTSYSFNKDLNTNPIPPLKDIFNWYFEQTIATNIYFHDPYFTWKMISDSSFFAIYLGKSNTTSRENIIKAVFPLISVKIRKDRKVDFLNEIKKLGYPNDIFISS